jgi:hypothetical protein
MGDEPLPEPVEETEKDKIIDRSFFIIGNTRDNVDNILLQYIVTDVYELCYRSALNSNNWNFCKFQHELEPLTQSTDNGFRFMYEVPENFLRLREVYPNKNFTMPLIEYEIRGGVIYANHSNIWVEYTGLVEEKWLSPEFKEYLSYVLADEIVYNITGDESQLTSIIKQRLIEKRQQAVTVDGIQNAPHLMTYRPYLDCRR